MIQELVDVDVILGLWKMIVLRGKLVLHINETVGVISIKPTI